MGKPNWALLVTDIGVEPRPTEYEDTRLAERVRVVASKWKNRNPDKEVSIVIGSGDLIYMGRYNEGVVIRIKGDDDRVTILTPEMATVFGRFLAGLEGEEGSP